jgi:hypothetical protein
MALSGAESSLSASDSIILSKPGEVVSEVVSIQKVETESGLSV